jgi:hypothetical protein
MSFYVLFRELYLGGMEEIIFNLKNRRRGGSDRYKNYDSFTIVGIYSLSCDFLASINYVKGNRIISKFFHFLVHLVKIIKNLVKLGFFLHCGS